MAETPQQASLWPALSADIIVLLHTLFVGFVMWAEVLILLGAMLGWEWVRDFPFRMVHLALVLFVGVQDLLGRICPLTTWENQLRACAGQTVNSKPFIGRLAHRLLMCHLSERTQKTIRISFAAVVLLTLVLVPPHWPVT